jgi:nitroreductase
MSIDPDPQLWQKKYGTKGTEVPGSVASFLTHRSIRRFTDEPISDSVLSGLIAAAQSAATSSNLQSWSVISIDDPVRRASIAEACDNQKQVITAPVFLVFLADLHRIEVYANGAGISPDGLDTAEMYTVAIVDAALAAERLVCAAESLGYGICYIGALRNNPERIKDLLNLPRKTFGVFGLCIGHPADGIRTDIKPKLRQDQVWFREQYPVELSSAEYDQRMMTFFAEQGMSIDETWSSKSGKRVNISGLSGRETLLKSLNNQGILMK